MDSNYGLRSWKFISGADVCEVPYTDFWVEYTGTSESNGQVTIGVVLHGVWEQPQENLPLPIRTRLLARKDIEDRLKLLRWTWLNKKGNLEISSEEPNAVPPVLPVGNIYQNITLKEVNFTVADSNSMLEYDLTFSYPVAETNGASGPSVARNFRFTVTADEAINPGFAASGMAYVKLIDSKNLIIQYSKEDKTIFKDIFRASPVRIVPGEGLGHVKLTSISQEIVAKRDVENNPYTMAERAQTEDEIRWWSWGYQGRSGTLDIDIVNPGVGETIHTHLTPCHFTMVTPNVLDLPYALSYELDFIYGYGLPI